MSIQNDKVILIKKIMEKHNLSRVKSKELLDSIFKEVINLLFQEGKVLLNEFGIFELIQRAPSKFHDLEKNKLQNQKVVFSLRFLPSRSVKQRARALVSRKD